MARATAPGGFGAGWRDQLGECAQVPGGGASALQPASFTATGADLRRHRCELPADFLIGGFRPVGSRQASGSDGVGGGSERVRANAGPIASAADQRIFRHKSKTLPAKGFLGLPKVAFPAGAHNCRASLKLTGEVIESVWLGFCPNLRAQAKAGRLPSTPS